ncbi:MAG: hypothetical protein O7D30_03000 [Rickettsia endosymbiont of Ixodes persulcatus]|nr:hypothetical protein [Rickettsia endosymbiont of Ixodes persulcatus]
MKKSDQSLANPSAQGRQNRIQMCHPHQKKTNKQQQQQQQQTNVKRF